MSKYSVIYDGSTKPGIVALSDGLVEACATFTTDDESRLFFGLLLDLRDRMQSAELRLARLGASARLLTEEIERYEVKP